MQNWKYGTCFVLGLVMVLSINEFLRHKNDQKSHQSSKESKPIFADRLSDCQCRSLFTIGSCGAEMNTNSKIPSHIWKQTVGDLRTISQGGNKLLSDILEKLYKYVPDYIFPDRDSSSTNHLVDVAEDFPSSQCGTHFYTADDVFQCLSDFKLEYGTKLRISFFGDSISRILLQQLLETLQPDVSNHPFDYENRHLDLKFNGKSKDVYINGKNVYFRFIWAPYIAKKSSVSNPLYQGGYDAFSSWENRSSSISEEPRAHLVYLAGGMWNAIFSNDLRAVSAVLKAKDIIKPLLIKLSGSTSFILHQYSPLKHWAKKDTVCSSLDFINQVLRLKFNESPVTIWDTIALLYGKERSECFSLFKNGLRNSSLHLGCNLLNHPGKYSRQIGVNMIWNLVCNKYRGKPSLCCS